MTLLSAFITDVAGPEITRDEWRFLQDARPAGLILFARNCQSPEQVRALVDSFRDAVCRDDLLVLIDQEGGRVQRMKPPHWRALPPAAAFGALYRQDRERGLAAARAASQLVGLELARHGINMNCAPVVDLLVPGAHGVIGDRAFGADPVTVTALGRAVAEGLMNGGVLPVIKHIPGHGRATRDSHDGLPTIDASLEELIATDFVPFRELADLPAAMTGHVVISAVDPSAPVSVSRPVVSKIIRREIGFDGLLISDDIGMKALSGTIEARALGVVEAGCDLILHCNGSLDERIKVADSAPLLDDEGLARYEAAFDRLKATGTFDASEALAALEAATAAKS